jgi:hypothetical protein
MRTQTATHSDALILSTYTVITVAVTTPATIIILVVPITILVATTFRTTRLLRVLITPRDCLILVLTKSNNTVLILRNSNTVLILRNSNTVLRALTIIMTSRVLIITIIINTALNTTARLIRCTNLQPVGSIFLRCNQQAMSGIEPTVLVVG